MCVIPNNFDFDESGSIQSAESAAGKSNKGKHMYVFILAHVAHVAHVGTCWHMIAMAHTTYTQHS